MTTRQDVILASTGVTYRQLDWWCRQGYLNSRYVSSGKNAGPSAGGSGTRRDFDADEMAVAIRMARLVDRGFTPKAASRVARVSIETSTVHLGHGICLTISDEEETP